MRTRRSWSVVVVTLLVALVAACGGDDKGSSAPAASSTPAADTSFVDAAKQRVEELYEGTYREPPPSPRPQPGKEILLISCGQAFSTCAEAMAGATRAGKAMGWKTQIYDTKGDPAEGSAGIRQAIAAGADGVFLYFIDCRLMRQALREAQRAKLPVVAAESLDCDYGGSGQEPLFTGVVTYVEGDYDHYITAFGKAQADYVIAKTDGRAKTIIFTEDDLLGAVIQQKAEFEELAKCSGCTVYEAKYTFADLGNPLQQKAEQALLKYPDADSIIVQADAIFLAGISAAIQNSGRDLLVVVGEGAPPTIDLVRSGVATAGGGIPIPAEGYAGMDILNRHFHGAEQASSGIGLQLYDKDHNLPPAGKRYIPPIDFEAAYRKAWGLE